MPAFSPELRRLRGLSRVTAPQVWAIAALAGCGAGNGASDASPPDAADAGSDSRSDSPEPRDGGPLRTIPLSGCPLGFYYAPVTIAGDAFTLIFDTGSSDTAVALSICATCAVSPKFSAPSGSCSTNLDMKNRLSFAGGVCSETVSVGGELPVVTMKVFGIERDTGFFTNIDCTHQPHASEPGYQGILGMGPLAVDTIGHANDDAYMSQLAAQGVADEFGVLLCSVGGRVWFGGYDPSYAKGEPRYTPLGIGEGWEIAVTSLGLGSKNLGAGARTTYVDTGSQFYSIPSGAYKALVTQSDPGFTKIFGAKDLGSIFATKSCVVPAGAPTPAEVDAALPPMTLTLPSVGGGSFTLSLPATASYLVPATPPGSTTLEYCFAIQDSAMTGNFALIGGPMLRANITIFDLAHSRLGFAPQAFCK